MAAGTREPIGNSETIDLQQQVARMQALLEASRQVHSTIHENEVLDRVLRIVVRELEMSGAAFSGTGLVYGDNPESARGARLPSWPLEDREGGKMAELVVQPPAGRALSLYEADFLEGLVLQAAVALENARNHKRNVEFARLQQDLDAARRIQQSLLPQSLPKIAGYSLGFRSDTCYEVGGDYLDIVEQPDGSLLMAVADVAGKGLASAIVSIGFRAAFRGMAATGLPLVDVAGRMNQHQWGEGEESRRRYVTAIFLRLDPVTGQMEVVNAGHNPGYLLTPDGGLKEFDASGTPLGLLPGRVYAAEKAQLVPGARLLFYTDGLTEVFRGDEEFGAARLLHEFRSSSARKAEVLLDGIWKAIREFSAGSPQADDMTALAVYRAVERES
jgi:serine phosphatase RsbU (regulator of sigma subunit)